MPFLCCRIERVVRVEGKGQYLCFLFVMSKFIAASLVYATQLVKSIASGCIGGATMYAGYAEAYPLFKLGMLSIP
jgi:hypothetical protein